MSLTIEKEKVLEAAEKCPTAKDVLKTLFPTAFEAEWEPVSPYEIKADIFNFPPGSKEFQVLLKIRETGEIVGLSNSEPGGFGPVHLKPIEGVSSPRYKIHVVNDRCIEVYRRR